MRVVNVVGTAVVALLAGCSRRSEQDVKPLAPRAQQADEMIDVSSMSASVLGVKDPQPACPVYPHAEGSLAARGVAGVIQYRWERGDSTQGPLRALTLPPAGADGIARAKLAPDDWADTLRGVQREVSEQVHITYPFAVHSAPITIQAKCY